MNAYAGKQVLCVVGARPNFMKIAPIIRAIEESDSNLQATLLHTGQHYDAAMKHAFFDQLDIPEPDVDLGVGSGSHAVQTAQIMLRFEPILDRNQPDVVLVVGDVNSTIACALVAVKRGIPVVHVEAGLRSRDRSMPEEINRILTDQLSDLLFTTEREALANLEAEGIDPAKVYFVGNVMIDTLYHNLSRAVPADATLKEFGEPEKAEDYGLVTLHRPSNVDDPVVLERLFTTLSDISRDLPLVFPMHPRTRERMQDFGLEKSLSEGQIRVLPPQGYLEMVGLMRDAKVVLTDSGGIQEETTALGIPCITLRHNTERPITVTEGTNTIVGTDPARIQTAFDAAMQSDRNMARIPECWDGKAAQRIVSILADWLAADQKKQAGAV